MDHKALPSAEKEVAIMLKITASSSKGDPFDIKTMQKAVDIMLKWVDEGAMKGINFIVESVDTHPTLNAEIDMMLRPLVRRPNVYVNSSLHARIFSSRLPATGERDNIYPQGWPHK